MNNDLLIGKPLPNFELQTSNNKLLKAIDLKGKLKLIFIYPKNDTSGCTKENILFSENIKEFDKLKINLFGLSKDSVESHIKFIKKYNLEIELISDPDIKLIKDLGSWVKKSMYGKEYMGVERSTFLIDQNNKIVEIWRKVKVNGHVEKVLNSCKNLIN
ncbi:MAG: peroxiredoxin [Rhodobacterales bacterium]|nr:MAG: peroxiredoxin [Rhodobacterales bacterium]|tara:strand:- start:90 stop:566 length:477 start_codon:yes stop_codon:yes gene_type:complete